MHARWVAAAWRRAAGALSSAARPTPARPVAGNATANALPDRATLLATVDEPGEVEAAEAWLAAARDRLGHVSDQLGCGCCILMWDVAGPPALLDTIPPALRCDSEWTRPDPHGR